MTQTPYKIAVLVSGNGSNLQALIDAIKAGVLSVAIVGVISNNANAYALTRAQQAGITSIAFAQDSNDKPLSRQAFERKALAQLKKWQPNLLVLAGFMRILTPAFMTGLHELNLPAINLHPSLLPQYKGRNTHQRVLMAGDLAHGCSVHMLTEDLDAGKVLTQARLTVSPNDDVHSLQQRVHTLEHQLLPWTVWLLAKGLLTQKTPLPLPWCLHFDV